MSTITFTFKEVAPDLSNFALLCCVEGNYTDHVISLTQPKLYCNLGRLTDSKYHHIHIQGIGSGLCNSTLLCC